LISKANESRLIIDFTQKVLAETASFPYIILRDYQALGLDEKELVTLLRILHPYFATGQLTLRAIAKEFAVTADAARVIVAPFINKGLLVEDPEGKCYTCDGIFTCFYERWISCERQNKKAACGNAKSLVRQPSDAERTLAEQLAKVYRMYEQELGRSLSPLQSEEIRSWLEKDQLPPELIEEALKRAVFQEKRNFAYIRSILKKWRDAGFTDLATVLQNDRKPAAAGKEKSVKQQDAKRAHYNEIYEKY